MLATRWAIKLQIPIGAYLREKKAEAIEGNLLLRYTCETYTGLLFLYQMRLLLVSEQLHTYPSPDSTLTLTQ